MDLQGCVIIPAFNEEAVISRCLAPLSPGAEAGLFELIVICNGCVDSTAQIARSFPNVRVAELAQGSKPAALNMGDQLATAWPRLYLDADVVISAKSVLEVLSTLRRGDAKAARPRGEMDCRNATEPVQRYYRARERIFGNLPAMWYSGAYGLSPEGHDRTGPFPAIVNDDLYIDSSFDEAEKTIVAKATSVRIAPSDSRSLLAILRRQHRGAAELSGQRAGGNRIVRDSGRRTAIAALRSISGPESLADAAAFLILSASARLTRHKSVDWDRDESSRSHPP